MKCLLKNALQKSLPENRIGTFLFDLSLFWVAHRRLPRKPDALVNDYLFTLKRDGTLRDIERQITSDKWMVKMWSREVLERDICVPTVALLETPDAISTFVAPSDVVLKPTHLSGSVIVLREGEQLSFKATKMLTECLSRSLWREGRAENYRYLRPRIIAEQMLPDALSTRDYKFFCFNGEPRLIQVDQDRHTHHKRTIYDASWSILPISYNFQPGEPEPRPEPFDEAIEIVRILSSRFTFVRVDLYFSHGRIFLGEITHCPENAHGRFSTCDEESLFSRCLFA